MKKPMKRLPQKTRVGEKLNILREFLRNLFPLSQNPQAVLSQPFSKYCARNLSKMLEHESWKKKYIYMERILSTCEKTPRKQNERLVTSFPP